MFFFWLYVCTTAALLTIINVGAAEAGDEAVKTVSRAAIFWPVFVPYILVSRIIEKFGAK